MRCAGSVLWQVVVRLLAASGEFAVELLEFRANLVNGCPSEDKQGEQGKQDQDDDGDPLRESGCERCADEVAKDAPTVAGRLNPCTEWVRPAGKQVTNAAGGEGEHRQSDPDSGVRTVLLRMPEKPKGEANQQQWDRDRNPTKDPRNYGVDSVADKALQTKPLAGSRDYGEGKESERHSVPPVFRGQVACAVPHFASGTTQNVGSAQPHASDNSDWECMLRFAPASRFIH